MKYFILLLLFGYNTTSIVNVKPNNSFYDKLSTACISLTKYDVEYDSSYFRIPYPNGDVPKDKGVCTDVVIRAYRKMGIDLQKEVHEDMKSNFEKYPKIWGLKKPDTNIDHRRVPNLQVFFKKYGEVKTITQKAEDYKPGDILTWMLNDKLPHIGIVVNKKIPTGNRYMVVHNVGRGQVIQDYLFEHTITGHYRYKK